MRVADGVMFIPGGREACTHCTGVFIGVVAGMMMLLLRWLVRCIRIAVLEKVNHGEGLFFFFYG